MRARPRSNVASAPVTNASVGPAASRAASTFCLANAYRASMANAAPPSIVRDEQEVGAGWSHG